MVVVLLTTVFPSLPGMARILNDNHCKDPQVQLDLSVFDQNKSSQNYMPRTVYLRPAIIDVPIVIGTGQPQKKGFSPAPCLTEIKHVKSVSFVSPCHCVPPVPSALNVVESPPVGGRLQRFWEAWLNLGSNPRVVSILKEGYSLP